MTRRDDGTIGHLCVVLLSGLGDVVNGLPVINALRAANPSLRITWVVEPMPAAILEGHSSIDNVVVYRRSDGARGLRALWPSLRRHRPFDATINLNVYFKSVWPTLFSGAPRRIGFDRSRSFEGVWLASNEHVPARPRAHTADMFAEFAEYLGAPISEPEWKLVPSADDRREQEAFRERAEGRPVVTVIPASGSYKKDWVSSRWAEVIDALVNHWGFRVALAGGPGKREQGIAREIVAASSIPVQWEMGDSVRRLAAVIRGSNLVLAPDTGPVHIARALGVPVIGIYGHTNPWRVGPWRAFEDLWIDHYTDQDRGPDPSNREPKWNVMETISSAEVLQKVDLAVTRYRVLGA